MAPIALRPQEMSASFLRYKIPFDVNAKVEGKVLKIERRVIKNYFLQGLFGEDPVDCCVMFCLDWPDDRDIVLETNAMKRKAHLSVKYFLWRNRVKIESTVEVSAFNGKGRSGPGMRDHRFSFKLDDIARQVNDGITITLGFDRAPNETSVCNAMGAAFASGDHSDVTLECEDGCAFPCHKVILAARSETFAAMFNSNFMESAANNVIIREMKSEVMQALLKFIYTGGVSLASISVDLLRAADMYMVYELRRQCCEVLSKQVTTSNCCQMLKAGNQYDDTLFQKAIEMLIVNGRRIAKSDEFNNMAEDGQLWKRISKSILENSM